MAKFTIELQDDTVKCLQILLTRIPQDGPMGTIDIPKLSVMLLGDAAMVVRRPESRQAVTILGVLYEHGYRAA